ncbi:MAG: hypothetical protein Q8J78_13705 [Moraxellaceae bacterium]|nr:hypothetical protein [Moraxellaceae bacterium]
MTCALQQLQIQERMQMQMQIHPHHPQGKQPVGAASAAKQKKNCQHLFAAKAAPTNPGNK